MITPMGIVCVAFIFIFVYLLSVGDDANPNL